MPIPGGKEEGPEDQFASWLPYSAYIPEERLFVNRETLGFVLEVSFDTDACVLRGR